MSIYWPVFAPMVLLPAAGSLVLKFRTGSRPWWLAIPESVIVVWLTYLVTAQAQDLLGSVWLWALIGVELLAGSGAWGPASLVRDLVCLWCLRRTIAYSPDWTFLPASDLMMLAGRQAVLVAAFLTLNGDRFRMVGRGATWLRDWMRPTTAFQP